VLVRGAPDVLAEVTAAAAAELRLAEGGPVFASLKAVEVRLVDV
jgi:molybdopterin-binding protein